MRIRTPITAQSSRCGDVTVTFTLGADGAWTYTLDNADADFPVCAGGGGDGDRGPLCPACTSTLRRHPKRERPVRHRNARLRRANRRGASIGGVYDGSGDGRPAATTSRRVGIVPDRERPGCGSERQSRRSRVVAGTSTVTFTLGADGAWTYTLDNADADFPVCAGGQGRRGRTRSR